MSARFLDEAGSGSGSGSGSGDGGNSTEVGKYAHVHAVAPYAVAHGVLMLFAFACLFPLGILAGRKRSRWHIPLQLAGVGCVTIAVLIIMSRPGGPGSTSVHAITGFFMLALLALQALLGMALKAARKACRTAARVMARVHSSLAWFFVPAAWMVAYGGLIHFLSDPDGIPDESWGHMIAGPYILMTAVPMHAWAIGYISTERLAQISLGICVVGGVVILTCIHWWMADANPLRWAYWAHSDKQHMAIGVLLIVSSFAAMWFLFLSDSRHRIVLASQIVDVVLLLAGGTMAVHAQKTPWETMIHRAMGVWIVIAVGSIVIAMHTQDESRGRLIARFSSLSTLAAGTIFTGAPAPITSESMTVFMAPTYVIFACTIAIAMYVDLDILFTAALVGAAPRYKSLPKSGADADEAVDGDTSLAAEEEEDEEDDDDDLEGGQGHHHHHRHGSRREVELARSSPRGKIRRQQQRPHRGRRGAGSGSRGGAATSSDRGRARNTHRADA